MSASIAGPSVPSQARDWVLPIPQEISTDDSFSNDLIRQFDKKRSRLRVELKLEQQGSDSDSASTSRVGSSKQPIGGLLSSSASLSPSPSSLPITTRVSGTAPASINSNNTTATADRGMRTRGIGGEGKRRRSAGDLLRRSSAFLRAKIESLRGPSRSHDNLQHDYHGVDEDEDQRRYSIPPPSKIVVNTTIAIPQFNTTTVTSPNSHHHGNRFLSPVAASIQPPVITQYPPKPLKYSPVEPIMLEENQKKSLHHRISMPVLRNSHVGGSHSVEPRRRSDVGIERMGSIGKRARKALGSPCAELKNRGGISRKGKEPIVTAGSPSSTATSSTSSSAIPTTGTVMTNNAATATTSFPSLPPMPSPSKA